MFNFNQNNKDNKTSTSKLYKMCMHKKVIKTEEFARKLADAFSVKYGKKTTYYFCPICQNYHLTTKSAI